VVEHNLRGIPALQPVFEHIDATALAAAGGLSEPEPEPELEPESAAVSAAVLQEGTPPLKMKDCVALLQDEIGGISGLSPKDTIAAAAEAYGIELDASDTVKQQLHTLAKECGIETGW
jgi:hypothetical protein